MNEFVNISIPVKRSVSSETANFAAWKIRIGSKNMLGIPDIISVLTSLSLCWTKLPRQTELEANFDLASSYYVGISQELRHTPLVLLVYF